MGSRIIHHINKMAVPLELDTVYRLISSPQWVAQDSLFPTDPQLIADIHQAVLDEAFLPCPEPEPERLDAQDEENDEYERVDENDDDDDACDAACDDAEYDDEADDWDPDTDAEDPDWDDEYEADDKDSEPIRPAANCQSEEVPKLETKFRQLLARLDLTVDSNRKIIPKFQREKSAKLPKNLFLSEIFYEQYKTDSLCKKILAKNLLSLPDSHLPAVNSLPNPELEIFINHLLSPALPSFSPTQYSEPETPLSLIPLPFSLISFLTLDFSSLFPYHPAPAP